MSARAAVGGAHMLQGTPPTVMVRPEGRPVSRRRPVMVSAVPPALGPLSGDTPITKGSWEGKRSGFDFRKYYHYCRYLIIVYSSDCYQNQKLK